MAYAEDLYTESLNGEMLEDYLEDDDMDFDDEAFGEDDDMDFDDESFGEDDDVEFEDEAVRFKGFKRFRPRRRFSRPAVSTRRRNFSRRFSRPYKGRGVIRTAAGSARIRLPRNLATKTELKNSLATVGRDIQRNAKAVVKINSRLNILDTRYNTISKSIASNVKKVDKMVGGLQQHTLISSLLQPKLEEITLESTAALNTAEGDENSFKVKTTKVDNTTSLLLAMMGGGFGGGSGGGNNMMMPLLLITALDDKNGDDDKDKTMLLVLAMMMGQKR